ncbi:MAG: DMT family transporter [Pseudomonadota bacterium]|nr:DMT family transporter [Pseudomonadota bacterium]
MSIHLKLLIACVFWGVTPTIGRVLAEFEAPFVTVFGRFFVAAVFLLWFTHLRRQFVALPASAWLRLSLLGATGIFLHNVLLFKGLEYTTATNGSIVLALIAVQVAVLDFIFYRRTPDWIASCGIVIAFFGTAFVLTDGKLTMILEIGAGIGESIVFVSALMWAIYSVVVRVLLEEYSPLLVTTYVTTIGTLLLFPFLFRQPEVTLAVYTDGPAIAMLFFMGFVGSAVGFLWFSEAIASIGPIGTSVYINLVPVWGVVWAVVLLGEEAGFATLVGGLMVTAGLMLVNRPRLPWRAGKYGRIFGRV